MKKKVIAKNELSFTNKTSSKKYILAIIVLVVISLICIGLLVLMNNSFEELKKDYSSLSLSYDSKISSLNQVIFSLNKNNSDLNSALRELTDKFNSLSSKAANLEQSYSVLKEEVNTTISKIDSYEKEIQSSLDWFSNNSTLEGSEKVLLNLKSNCKKETTKECSINLGCFHLVNKEFLNFVYKNDFDTSKTEDKLQSIEEFIISKGGDCEDFSLFFKAEYNSLVSYCRGKPVLFAWKEDKGNKFWANFDNTWYLPDASKVYLDKNNIFPSVVCGAISDPQTGKVNGHCVLAFVSKRIISSDDISVLNSSELVEPQTGEYLGFIGIDSGVFLISDNSTTESYIDTLITDEDFYIFRNNEWASYKKFGTDLNIQKENLNSLIKN